MFMIHCYGFDLKMKDINCSCQINIPPNQLSQNIMTTYQFSSENIRQGVHCGGWPTGQMRGIHG